MLRRRGMEEAVPHIVGASPHQLHWFADLLRQLDSFIYVVNKKSSAESAAHQRGVNLDLLRREAKHLSDVLVRGFRGLGRSPHFARFGPHISGAIHDLNWRMRFKGIVINSFQRFFGMM